MALMGDQRRASSSASEAVPVLVVVVVEAAPVVVTLLDGPCTCPRPFTLGRLEGPTPGYVMLLPGMEPRDKKLPSVAVTPSTNTAPADVAPPAPLPPKCDRRLTLMPHSSRAVFQQSRVVHT